MIAAASGGWRLSVDPALGGSIASLTWRDQPILRRAPEGNGDILRTACFPLTPYANRIMDARFVFGGRAVSLPVLEAFRPHALHGDGWLSPWRVEAATADSAVLVHDHAPDAWPWAYRAVQAFTLSEAGLRIDLSLRNDSDEAAPAGLGLHPYFPRGAETRLTLAADGAWDVGAPGVPWRAIQPGDSMDWSKGRAVAEAPFIDHAYSGWDGRARIDQDGHAVLIAASGNCPITQVFTPMGEDFLCVEPVTHRPGALNGAADAPGAMAVLEPGQTLAMWMTVSVDSAAQA